jgi:hypothetical protein
MGLLNLGFNLNRKTYEKIHDLCGDRVLRDSGYLASRAGQEHLNGKRTSRLAGVQR